MPTTPLSELTAARAAFGRVVARAEVVYDGLGLPRADGAVVIQRGPGVNSVIEVGDAARVAAVLGVGAAHGVARQPATYVDCGFAISPPVVNAHTHLGLSAMPYTPGPHQAFTSAVERRGREGGRGVEAARRGLTELGANGTSLVGDFVTDEGVMELVLGQSGVGGVAYWEVFAPREDDAEAAFGETVRALARFRERQRPGGMRVGIAPHAPHTVSATLLVRLAAYARAEGLPLAIPVAESPEERDLHLGRGPLPAELAAVGATFSGTSGSPIRYLHDLGVLEGAPTLVHGVTVDEDDVRLVARAGCVVVHCPRSNQALACGEFPWTLYAKHGVELAFGTESRCSSPDLDVTREVAAALAAQGQRLNPRAAVRAAVKGGHKALGLTPPRVTRGAGADELVAWGPLEP